MKTHTFHDDPGAYELARKNAAEAKEICRCGHPAIEHHHGSCLVIVDTVRGRFCRCDLYRPARATRKESQRVAAAVMGR